MLQDMTDTKPSNRGFALRFLAATAALMGDDFPSLDEVVGTEVSMTPSAHQARLVTVPEECPRNHREPWKPHEDEGLKLAYENGTPTLGALARRWGRTRDAVVNRARRLGLSRPGLDEDKQKVAAALVATGYSYGKVVEQLGMSKQQVQRACKKHGVRAGSRKASVRK